MTYVFVLSYIAKWPNGLNLPQYEPFTSGQTPCFTEMFSAYIFI